MRGVFVFVAGILVGAAFQTIGLTVSDPGAPSAFTGGILANITDPNAGRIELSEQPPEGKLRKAMESWR
jgi:hypothetical protein